MIKKKKKKKKKERVYESMQHEIIRMNTIIQRLDVELENPGSRS